MVELLQNDLDCQDIEEKSNSSDNGENMKNDKRLGHEVIKFMEKKNLFSSTECTSVCNLQKCLTLKR